MYQFPEEMRRAYESSALSFVYYQNIGGKAVPVLASSGFCEKTGKTREEVLSWLASGMYERMHPDDVGAVSKISQDFLKREGSYDVVFRVRLGGKYEYIHGFGRWQTMPGGTELAVIVYVNVTQAKDQIITFMGNYDLFREDRFYTDPLTGLPNINYLHEFGEEKAGRIRSEGNTPSVVYMDVYSMQSYNNQYGLSEGDELLRLVAATLREMFPKALLIRGSDDHFIILTGVDDREQMERRIAEVNASIRRRATGNTAGLRSGVCPVTDGMEIEDALDHAKRTLKRIENDMNCEVAYFSQTEDDLYWRSRYIVETFDRALKNGWIKVYYQGLFRIESEKAAALEALARWIDPNRGVISPVEFIPVLQKYHQLYKLDLFMFEQVCKEVKIRQKNHLPLIPVSVNFSRQDFDHTDIVARMDEIYNRQGMEQYVDKSCFIVEITEQDVAVGAESFREQLRRIRESGYRIWLDDFGSGYSSFNMFNQFQFDLLKYDMDLLRHLDDNGGINRILLKELVNLARELKIHTLVEGLESEEQLGFIREIGCELAQGYYFNKPEPLDELLEHLRGGDQAKSCETKEERESLNRKWME